VQVASNAREDTLNSGCGDGVHRTSRDRADRSRLAREPTAPAARSIFGFVIGALIRRSGIVILTRMSVESLSTRQTGPDTATAPAEVAVLIVACNGRQFLEECLPSIWNADQHGIVLHVVVVDNGSSDGSAVFVRERFPRTHVVVSETNLGYAGGNNFGWKWIEQRFPSVQTLVLLNQDTVVDRAWLPPMVRFLRQHPRVAAVQPKLLLDGPRGPAPLPRDSRTADRINTAGNRSHFLGFGFMTGYGEPDDGRFDEPRKIDFGSGAALALRADVVRHGGLFDNGFGLYLEDMELGWRLRLMGFETWYVPDSVVWHKHAWQAPYRHYASLESNRFRLLLTHLRVPTLLLLSPALALMELGQLWFTARHGLWRDWAKARGNLVRPSWWRNIDSRRKQVRRLRVISDHELMRDFSGRLNFSPIDSPLLRLIGNPLLNLYWRIARRLQAW
jgi:GT2 family glycosyltransferase